MTMPPCYDSTLVADNEAFAALPSRNNGLKLLFTRTACNELVRPISGELTADEKVAIDANVLKAVGLPLAEYYAALKTDPKTTGVDNRVRFNDFGVAVGVGDISCAIDSAYKGCK